MGIVHKENLIKTEPIGWELAVPEPDDSERDSDSDAEEYKSFLDQKRTNKHLAVKIKRSYSDDEQVKS